MKKNEEQTLFNPLNEQEQRNINGGYSEPTEEELKRLESQYGPWAKYIICF